MKASLLRELALVVMHEEEALRRPYAWPPAKLTEEDRRESDRLHVLERRISYRAACAEYDGNGE